MRHRYAFRLVIALLFLLKGAQVSVAQANEGLVPDSTELRVLRQFIYATAPAATWQSWKDLPLQQWPGARMENGDVFYLYYGYNGLKGPLHPCLGELRQLQYLTLTQNQLTGPIPDSYRNWTQLRELSIDQNRFTGPLPEWIGSLSQLEWLSLNSNLLSGSLPASLGSLTHLRGLFLSDNQFSGGLPASIGQLTAVQQLDLSRNQLSGPIPGEWGRMQALHSARLSNNQLSGPLPASLGQWSQVEEFSAQTNALTGPLPASLGNWHQVRYLSLHENRLNGAIPPAWGRLRQLQQLQLTGNQLSGSIPDSLGNLSNLVSLHLSGNQLSGVVPASLGQLTNLTELVMWNNQLTGPLPPELGQLKRLVRLEISGNRLTGSLPAAWSGMTSLQRLILSRNYLSGAIPRSWQKFTQLYEVRLQDNRLSGPLTDSLGIETLDLANNQLSGRVPDFYARSPRTRYLFLTGNALTSLPDFTRHPLGTNVVLPVQGNYLDAGSIERNMIGPGQLSFAFVFNDQRQRQPAETVSVVKGQRAVLHRGMAGLHNHYQWQRRVGQAWVSIPGATDSTYVIERVDESSEGEYQVAVTNDWIYYTTFFTRPLLVDMLPYAPLPYNEPVATGCADLQDSLAPKSDSPLTGPINYVRTYSARQAFTDPAALTGAGKEGVQVKTEYVDGLGRPVQTVLRQDSPSGRDIVQPMEYDAVGRQARQYLPFTANGSTAAGAGYYPNALVEQYAFYRGAAGNTTPTPDVVQATKNLPKTGVPFSETAFEASPLNRPLAQASPGESWMLSANHAVTLEERPNTVADAVQRWQPGYQGDREDLLPQGTYAAGELWMKQTRDEQGQTAQEFTDKEGHLVLKQVQFVDSTRRNTHFSNSGTLCQLVREHQEVVLTAPAGSFITSIQLAEYGDGAGADCSSFTFRAGCSANVTAAVQRALVSQLSSGNATSVRLVAENDWLGDPCNGTLKWFRVIATYGTAVVDATPEVEHWLKTYYVYDDFGRLRAVVPPKAVQQLQHNPTQPWAVEGAGVERLLFRYHYDEQGRLIEKKVPDQDGYAYTVYDELDRPILTQDVAQQARKEWIATKYDALGRVVYTALVQFPGLDGSADQQRMLLQQQASASTAPLWEVPTASASLGRAYYTHTSFPDVTQQPGAQLLTVSYYDSYDFNQDGVAEAQYQAPSAAELACKPEELPQVDLRVTGQATRVLVRVLGVDEFKPEAWLTTTTFFDEKLRPIQVQSTNARGGTDLVTTRYDFTGKALALYAVHQGPNHTDLHVREQSRYDHAGRLLTITQELDGAKPQVLARHTYNELGQLDKKELGGSLPTGVAVTPPLPNGPGPASLQTVDYRYNIRGWLTQINDVQNPDPKDLWSFSLSYDCGFITPQFNGNIAGQTWRSASDGIERAYGYRYDQANRLLQGDFVARTSTDPSSNWNAERGNYRFSFASYDAGGNLLTLRRRGLVQAATRTTPAQYAETDNLRYTYTTTGNEPASNRLQRVDDKALASTSVGMNQSERPDFSDGTTTGSSSPDYTYDAAGSLLSDRNRNITSIRYNYLHLPDKIQWSNGNTLEYLYTATGQKVAKVATEVGKPKPVRTDYLGAWQYEKDSLRWMNHSEGRALRRISPISGQVSYAYEYTLKDHLGNLRVAFHQGETSTSFATMELAQASREEQQFDSSSIASSRAYVTTQFGHNGSQYAAKLHAGGTQPQPLGPLKQLTVSRGDTIDVQAFGMYNTAPGSTSWGMTLASFVANLIQPQPTTFPGGDGHSKARVLPLLSIGLSVLPAVQQVNNQVPNAYLRVLVFNKDSALVLSQCRLISLTGAAKDNYEELGGLANRVVLKQEGYVQVYVANESTTDVYFDDLMVIHRQGLQVQENHYDPFGLDLAGLNKMSSPENHYTYNGKEKQTEFGLNWQDYGWRMYDSSIGRWNGVDPLSEISRRWSTYTYVYNNPISFVDPDGMKVKFADGTSPEDKKRFRAEQRELNKKSETAKSDWKALKKSKEINTVYLNKTEKNSRGEDVRVSTQTKPKESGKGSDIYIDLDDNKIEGVEVPFGIVIGHEEAHALRIQKGEIEQPWSPSFDDFVGNKKMTSEQITNKINESSESIRIHEEKEASHIENIIRAEYDPTGKVLPLREVYSNIPRARTFGGNSSVTTYPPQNVIKQGYNYYKKK